MYFERGRSNRRNPISIRTHEEEEEEKEGGGGGDS